MPSAAVIATSLRATAQSRAISVFIGGKDVTSLTKWDAVHVTDSGGSVTGTAEIRLEDAIADLPEVKDQAIVEVSDHTAGDILFSGHVRSRKPIAEPTYTHTQVRAIDRSSILDDSFIDHEERPAETMQARLGFFWGYYAGSHLSGDFSKVASIGSILPAADYTLATLRQVIERVIAQASSSADYYVDAAGRLHVFTNETNDAPWIINADDPDAGANEIAPESLTIDYDTASYANAVYVAGGTPEGSGYFYDHAAIAAAKGLVRTSQLNAPDCETAAMATSVANMYLGRVSSAKPRGTFSVTQRPTGLSRIGFRGGQNVTITASDLDLDADEFRIHRVTTSFARPGASLLRTQDIEWGWAAGSSRGRSDSLGSGVLVSGQMGGASNVYVSGDGVSVTDGTRVRAHIGRLAGGTYGITITDSSGNVLIDGQKIQLSQSEGTLPAGVKLGINQTTITASGVVVNDGTRDRVILGDI